ncbi:MAG: radical SAM protein [Nanoarchaeota archaeon]
MDISKFKYNSPYSCYVNLTTKCNLRCRHCFGDYSKPEEKELSLEEWKKVIEKLKESNVFFINISGGEPTQSPYFKEFIEYLSKKGMHFILTTNGVFSKEIGDFIIKNKEYLIGVKISLDGPDAESHGFIRLDKDGNYNPHLFNIVLGNIFFFKRHKIPTTIATVIHKLNINKIEKLQKLIQKINPISWFISPIIPLGRAEVSKFISQEYEYFDVDFWDNLYKNGRKKRINIRLIDMPVKDKNRLSAYGCAGALNFCEIHSDGTVSPCTLSRLCIPKKSIKFENIITRSLNQIWNGKSFEKFRDYMNKGCNGCKMLSKCNKCVAQSFKYFKNGYSPTPYCIKKGSLLNLKNIDKYKEVLKNKFKINL